MRFLEDVAVGERTTFGSHTFTAEEIRRFASAYDPQPFHMDEEAAARSHFGALCASGWHTAAMWMRFMVRHRQRAASGGAVMPDLGPSPGFDDLKWLKPVYAGDTIAFSTEVVAKRESRSRPGWGVVTSRNEAHNAAGDLVFCFTGHVLVQRRSTEPVGPEPAEPAPA